MKWIYFVIYLSLSFFFLIQWCKLQLGLYIRDHRGKSKLFTIQTRHNHKFLGSCELKAPIYTAISRKVVGKNVHATTPKGNMGYDQYTVSNDCSCRTYFCCFLLALTSVCPWPLMPFFQFLWRTGQTKPPTIPFGIVACAFSDNLSQNSCIYMSTYWPTTAKSTCWPSLIWNNG